MPLSKADMAVEAKETRGKEAPCAFLFFPKKTDPNWGDLYHPRGDYPPDPAIVQDIIDQGGVEKPIIVWQQVAFGGEVYIDGEVAKKGDPLLIVGDGSQRGIAAFAAQPIMKKKGMLGDGKRDLFIPIQKFIPSNPETAEREFLLLRQAHDADRLKKPHKPSVIAYNLFMCKKKGASEEQLMNVCPPPTQGWTKPIMEAALEWGNLSAAAAKAFDDGVEVKGKLRPVPITLLPVALYNSTKPEQVKTIVECLETGITSMKGWTRRQNAERGADTSGVDDDWDGEGEETGGSKPAGKPAKPAKEKTKTKKGTSGRRPKGRVLKALDMILAEKTALPDKDWYFQFGMSYEIGVEVDMKGISAEVRSFIAGISWVSGNDEPVPALIRDAYDRANDKQEVKAQKPKKEGKKTKAKPENLEIG
jgi:hypothetical protein